MQKFTKFFFLLCIVVFAISPKVSLSINGDEAYIIELCFPTSYDAKIYQNRADGILNIRYKVHLPFPSTTVLKFYDDKLKEIGWVPFIEPAYRDREWHHFTDGTVEGHPLVHQLLATWVNRYKNRMVVLGLRYYSTNLNETEKYCAKKPDNDIQEVIVQVMPFIILPDIEGGK